MKILGKEVTEFKEQLDKLIAEKSQQHVIIASEDQSSNDELALEHAKTYWMLGWSWDEIGSILEDMQFSKPAINKALKGAEEYAKDTTQQGAFGMLKDGQKIKLKNGIIGILRRKLSNVIQVTVGDDEVEIIKDDIDEPKTLELTEAFALRQAAKNLLRLSQKDLEKNYPKELELKRPETFSLSMTPKLQAPKWEHLPEELVDVTEASPVVEAHLNTLKAMSSELEKVQEELDTANELAKEVRGKKKELEMKRDETGKLLASILGKEFEASNELLPQVFRRLERLMVGYREIISTKQVPPTLTAEHDALKALIQEKVPDAFDEIMNALSTWRESNEGIVETLNKELSVYEYKPHHKKRESVEVTAGVWEKFTSWLHSTWKRVKESILGVEEAIPVLEETSDALESFLHNMEHAEKTAKISASIEKFLK